MRQRVEDLGRLAVLLEKLADNEIFEVFEPWRAKDVAEYFSQLPEEKRDEIIHKLAYGLRDMKSDLYELMSIADGTDLLNERNE